MIIYNDSIILIIILMGLRIAKLSLLIIVIFPIATRRDNIYTISSRDATAD